jgi:hypothetical protein
MRVRQAVRQTDRVVRVVMPDAHAASGQLPRDGLSRHALGYTTIRLTWRQVVNDPTWVTDRLATVLRR